MSDLALRRPIAALTQLGMIVLPEAEEGDVLELVIHSQGGNLSARDMAAYLQLTDRLWGRLQPNGIRSYAARPYEHLRLEEVRTGSLEMAIVDVLSQGAPPLLILWLCLKYIPVTLRTMAEAYKAFEEGALAKENRKRIRVDMDNDAALASIPKDKRAELARLVETLLEHDPDLVRRAVRFIEDAEVEVDIHVKRKAS